jgi:hypothetical protein
LSQAQTKAHGDSHARGALAGPQHARSSLFEVHVQTDAAGFAHLHWSRSEARGEWAQLSEGCYVLRSNITDWTPEELWRAYIQLTEAEAAFRIQKSDLQIRRSGINGRTVSKRISWFAFSLTCCGRPWPPCAGRQDWVANRASYSRT